MLDLVLIVMKLIKQAGDGLEEKNGMFPMFHHHQPPNAGAQTGRREIVMMDLVVVAIVMKTTKQVGVNLVEGKNGMLPKSHQRQPPNAEPHTGRRESTATFQQAGFGTADFSDCTGQ